MIHHNLRSSSARLGAITLAVGVAIGLAACQKKEAKEAAAVPVPAASASAPEVAAQVNGDDITAQQIEFTVHQHRNMRGDSDANNRAALEELIDRELEAQQAHKLKLDEQPQLQQTLEAFKRELLAREYLKNVAEKLSKPNAADAQKYYDEHKEMFADRQTYDLKRYEVTVAPDKRDAVVAKVGSFKTRAELEAWLKSQGLKFESTPLSVSSEQLQGPIGEKLKGLKAGQALSQPGGAGVAAFLVESIKPAPKSLDEARPQIETVLGSEIRRTALSNAAKDLRKDAKIEYRGKYAQPPASAASSGAPKASDSAASAAAPRASSASS